MRKTSRFLYFLQKIRSEIESRFSEPRGPKCTLVTRYSSCHGLPMSSKYYYWLVINSQTIKIQVDRIIEKSILIVLWSGWVKRGPKSHLNRFDIFTTALQFHTKYINSPPPIRTIRFLTSSPCQCTESVPSRVQCLRTSRTWIAWWSPSLGTAGLLRRERCSVRTSSCLTDTNIAHIPVELPAVKVSVKES